MQLQSRLEAPFARRFAGVTCHDGQASEDGQGPCAALAICIAPEWPACFTLRGEETPISFASPNLQKVPNAREPAAEPHLAPPSRPLSYITLVRTWLTYSSITSSYESRVVAVRSYQHRRPAAPADCEAEPRPDPLEPAIERAQ